MTPRQARPFKLPEHYSAPWLACIAKDICDSSVMLKKDELVDLSRALASLLMTVSDHPYWRDLRTCEGAEEHMEMIEGIGQRIGIPRNYDDAPINE